MLVPAVFLCTVYVSIAKEELQAQLQRKHVGKGALLVFHM